MSGSSPEEVSCSGLACPGTAPGLGRARLEGSLGSEVRLECMEPVLDRNESVNKKLQSQYTRSVYVHERAVV